MPDLDGRYAVLLDRWLEAYPHHWPLSVLSETLEGARAADAYDGGNPSPIPRSRWRAESRGRTRLLNEATGSTEEGLVCRLEERTDG